MMMFVRLVLSLLLSVPTESFRACMNNNNNDKRLIIISFSSCGGKNEHDNNDTTTNTRIILQDTTRRSLLFNAKLGLSSFVVGTAIFGTTSANAASTTVSSSDIEIAKDKIVKGYDRLNYLLEHWLEETTICGRDDNPYTTGKGCERTPVKVMDYLGYKNIKDPLFRADKTLQKLEPLIPVARFNEYLDAIEKWSEAAEEGNGMAYISSWGEANPGGGKDRVQLFIERARKNVIDSRDSLATVIDILDLK